VHRNEKEQIAKPTHIAEQTSEVFNYFKQKNNIQ